MVSTEPVPPLELSEDTLDKFDPHCSLSGVIPEHLIKRYDVPERVPKGKTGPALHNADMEQKRPRRKDTPALHMPPFVAGLTLLGDESPRVIMEDDEKDGDKLAI
ncbi:protein phosphatase 1 regulatory subunit 17 isoform X2 [Arvicola amphibius]|uniref:protein phosphatase 1 regulatory subunit 17 isoform X2 n=1 Tax=Arvicola amphibius TaxID=1047088 RepID=UPI0018E33187|nr:protein phosphatase 1 regulatory subunit 17 isoform X2 [Arvicola amphibius]